MKIALVAPEVFPVPAIRGGAVEGIVEETAMRLSLSGHEVHVFGVSDPALPMREVVRPSTSSARTDPQGLRTYLRWRPTPVDRLLLCSWKLPFKQSGGRWYYWPYSRWVAARIKRFQPDVIHVFSRIQFVPWLRKASPHASIVLSVHQLSSLNGPGVWGSSQIEACNLITGCSRFIVDEIAQRYPASAPLLRVLNNGIDLERFRPWWEQGEARSRMRRELGAEGPVILYAGRLVEQKGVHVLAEAFLKVASRHPSARLLIVGSHTYSDPALTPYIRRIKEQLKPVQHQVVWRGYVPREKMAEFYAASDVAVVPSVGPEAFPTVVLEAMATGLPVVAFRHGGSMELVQNDRTGILVELAKGSAGFSTALDAVLSSPAVREKFGKEARRDALERFSWDRIMTQIIRIYEEAVPLRQVQGKRRKVLIAESGSGFGGSARYLSDLASLLDRKRYDLRVVAAEEGPFIKKVREQGVPVTLRPGWRFEGGAKGIARLLLTAPQIFVWLKRNKIELVHLNNEIYSHLPMLLAARPAGVKTVCHLHGWRPFTRMERWAVRFVDELVVISHAGAEYYRQQLPRRRVTSIPNGLLLNGQFSDLEGRRNRKRQEMEITSRDTAALLVGRLVPWKGQEIFLRALADAMKTDPHLLGVIVGNDPEPGTPYLKRLQGLAKKLEIEPRVKFAPWQEDIGSVYAAADLVVHASTEPEPFGLVILEAMALKRPVIATAAGGVLDIVQDQQTGLLVKAGDARALAGAIGTLLHSPGLAAALANRAHHRVRTSFTMERNAEQVAAVYDKLMGSGLAIQHP